MASKASLIAKAFGGGGAFSKIADRTLAADSRKLSKNAMAAGATGMQTFADMAGLIAHTGMSNGDQALVTGLNKIFVYSVSGWFLIATVTNSTPTDITGVNGAYDLAIDGTATVITVASTDPEGFPLTFSHAVTAGSLTNGGGATATVVQGTGASKNVFTITPSTVEAYAGTFSLTFSVTDGSTGAVNAVSAFVLSFITAPQTLLHYIKNLTDDDARMGQTVSVSDSYVIAGMSNWKLYSGAPAAGRAKIFNPTTGALLFTLSNPAGSSTASAFGHSVGICEQFAIVGSRLSGRGSAYIYNPSTGSLLFTLTNPDPDSDNGQDYFGDAVAITNGYAIVGAWGENNSEGKAYIFSTSTGNLLHTLSRSGDSGSINSNPYFGYKVDISPTYSIVGAHNTDITGNGGAGRAYVFNNSTGALVHTVVNPNTYGTQSGDRFGIAVAINDTHFIVGANAEDTATMSATGAAYVFNTVAGTLNRTLTMPSPAINGSFGTGVTIHGDFAAVTSTGNNSLGKVYMYNFTDGTLITTLTDPETSGLSSFGGISDSVDSIDMNGTHLVVGVGYNDTGSLIRSGAIRIFN